MGKEQCKTLSGSSLLLSRTSCVNEWLLTCTVYREHRHTPRAKHDCPIDVYLQLVANAHSTCHSEETHLQCRYKNFTQQEYVIVAPMESDGFSSGDRVTFDCYLMLLGNPLETFILVTHNKNPFTLFLKSSPFVQ